MPVADASADKQKNTLLKKTRLPLAAALAAACWFTASAKGDEPAKDAKGDAGKADEAGDKPEYTKRGPFAGGAKHPAVCDHKLHLPILIPQATYDNKEYCGGKITLF